MSATAADGFLMEFHLRLREWLRSHWGGGLKPPSLSLVTSLVGAIPRSSLPPLPTRIAQLSHEPFHSTAFYWH